MRWWSELKYLVRKLNRRRAERELQEEIGAHLEMETQEKIADGLSREEARYAAQRVFGSVALATEDSRAWWGFGRLEELWQDPLRRANVGEATRLHISCRCHACARHRREYGCLQRNQRRAIASAALPQRRWVGNGLGEFTRIGYGADGG